MTKTNEKIVYSRIKSQSGGQVTSKSFLVNDQLDAQILFNVFIYL